MLRRVIAFIVFLGALYLARELRASGTLVGAVLLLPVLLIALLALVLTVFKLPVLGKRSFQDSGFENSVLSQSQGRVFGIFLGLIFGGAPIFIALRGVFRGVIPAPWSAPDIAFAQAPLLFLLSFAAFAGGGLLLGVLVVKGTWAAKFGKTG